MEVTRKMKNIGSRGRGNLLTGNGLLVGLLVLIVIAAVVVQVGALNIAGLPPATGTMITGVSQVGLKDGNSVWTMSFTTQTGGSNIVGTQKVPDTSIQASGYQAEHGFTLTAWQVESTEVFPYTADNYNQLIFRDQVLETHLAGVLTCGCTREGFVLGQNCINTASIVENFSWLPKTSQCVHSTDNYVGKVASATGAPYYKIAVDFTITPESGTPETVRYAGNPIGQSVAFTKYPVQIYSVGQVFQGWFATPMDKTYVLDILPTTSMSNTICQMWGKGNAPCTRAVAESLCLIRTDTGKTSYVISTRTMDNTWNNQLLNAIGFGTKGGLSKDCNWAVFPANSYDQYASVNGVNGFAISIPRTPTNTYPGSFSLDADVSWLGKEIISGTPEIVEGNTKFTTANMRVGASAYVIGNVKNIDPVNQGNFDVSLSCANSYVKVPVISLPDVKAGTSPAFSFEIIPSKAGQETCTVTVKDKGDLKKVDTYIITGLVQEDVVCHPQGYQTYQVIGSQCQYSCDSAEVKANHCNLDGWTVDSATCSCVICTGPTCTQKCADVDTQRGMIWDITKKVCACLSGEILKTLPDGTLHCGNQIDCTCAAGQIKDSTFSTSEKYQVCGFECCDDKNVNSVCDNKEGIDPLLLAVIALLVIVIVIFFLTGKNPMQLLGKGKKRK
jgi:hypothetical protein